MMDIDIINILKPFALKMRKPEIPYEKCIELIIQYLDKKNLNHWQKINEKKELDILPLLADLEKDNIITINKENSIVKSITIYEVITELINKEFSLIENEPKHPFPSESNLNLTSITHKILVIDIKRDFINLLLNLSTIEQNIFKITFPENITHIFVTKQAFESNLIKHAVLKLSNYLQMRINVGYMYSKLSTILKGSEIALNELLNNILTKPLTALNTLMKPDDFTYRFWAHFANLVLEDFKGKKDLLPEEHGYCQAAYLTGFYNAFQKSIIQKENKKNSDLKQLETFFKKPPYIFTLQELLSLTDNKGVPYVKKYSQQFVLDFLKDKTESKGDKQLPFIIGLKAGPKSNYFLQRDYVIPLFLEKLTSTSKRLRQEIIADWKELLKSNKKILGMLNDLEFLNDLQDRLANDYPLLLSLLNQNLLFVARESKELADEYKLLIDQCFDSDYQLRPLNILLGLERAKLYQEVKSLVPPWYTIPFIKQVYFFFKSIFTLLRRTSAQAPSQNKKLGGEQNREKENKLAESAHYLQNYTKSESELKSPAESKRDKAAVQNKIYKNTILKLKKHFLLEGERLEQKLDELAEKWNPLYDEIAKQNLVEDINSLIRDYIRTFKKSFKTQLPDAARISHLAKELAQNKALAKIKRKEFLITYIELALIQYIEQHYKKSSEKLYF